MTTILQRIFGLQGRPAPRKDVPVDETDFVVFDTELTGLDPKRDSIVSIGALRMTGSRIEIGRPFYRIVEPRTRLTGKSIVIHGITPSETVGCPDMASLLPEFLEFCGDRILVGHFIGLDIGFVNAEMKKTMGRTLENLAIDTISLYRTIRQCDTDRCAFYDEKSEDAGLYNLARRYGVQTMEAHNALGDAYVTAQLFQRFIKILQSRGNRSMGELLRAGRP